MVLRSGRPEAGFFGRSIAGAAPAGATTLAPAVAKALAGEGVTVVEVRQDDPCTWGHVQGSSWNRRITGTTAMAFSGPVSESLTRGGREPEW